MAVARTVRASSEPSGPAAPANTAIKVEPAAAGPQSFQTNPAQVVDIVIVNESDDEMLESSGKGETRPESQDGTEGSPAAKKYRSTKKDEPSL